MGCNGASPLPFLHCHPRAHHAASFLGQGMAWAMQAVPRSYPLPGTGWEFFIAHLRPVEAVWPCLQHTNWPWGLGNRAPILHVVSVSSSPLLPLVHDTRLLPPVEHGNLFSPGHNPQWETAWMDTGRGLLSPRPLPTKEQDGALIGMYHLNAFKAFPALVAHSPSRLGTKRSSSLNRAKDLLQSRSVPSSPMPPITNQAAGTRPCDTSPWHRAPPHTAPGERLFTPKGVHNSSCPALQTRSHSLSHRNLDSITAPQLLL